MAVCWFCTCPTLSLPPKNLTPISGVLSLFQQMLPASFMEQAQAQTGSRHNNCVYTPMVIMWLLIVQRLQGGSALECAVLELLSGLPASFWPRPCKRIRDWRELGKPPLSANTGAYSQARQALPFSMVEQSCDRIFSELIVHLIGSNSSPSPATFLLDGTSMRLAHSSSLMERFALGSNQHGAAHWPVVRVLVAHELHTGLAMRPEWGPMNGPDAVSEQKLLETCLERLPVGSTIMGDANFGVFSVAWAGSQSGHPVLLRMTSLRARSMAGEELSDGMDRPILWKPSRGDRRRHPGLPADACVQGRLIVRLVKPDPNSAPFLLSLFTTLSSSLQELLDLYGQRWIVETDLRTLKQELKLDQLTCLTPDMVGKEIVSCISAYNLVRAVTCLAAKQSGLPPRSYSFTRVRRIIQAFAPKVAHANDPQQTQKEFDVMMHYVQQAKLPRRRRPSYPRGVWPKGAAFPSRRS